MIDIKKGGYCVQINNEEESREVQECLTNIGFRWKCLLTYIPLKDYPVIIYVENSYQLSYAPLDSYKEYYAKDYALISYTEFMSLYERYNEFTNKLIIDPDKNYFIRVPKEKFEQVKEKLSSLGSEWYLCKVECDFNLYIYNESNCINFDYSNDVKNPKERYPEMNYIEISLDDFLNYNPQTQEDPKETTKKQLEDSSLKVILDQTKIQLKNETNTVVFPSEDEERKKEFDNLMKTAQEFSDKYSVKDLEQVAEKLFEEYPCLPLEQAAELLKSDYAENSEEKKSEFDSISLYLIYNGFWVSYCKEENCLKVRSK